VRDGKGERERFHDAAAWLAARHPRTLVANLERIAQVIRVTPCPAAAYPLSRRMAGHDAGFGKEQGLQRCGHSIV